MNGKFSDVEDLMARVKALEESPPPEAVQVVQERAKTPPPQAVQEKIEIPYVPSAEERAEEAIRACKPMVQFEVDKLQKEIDSMSVRLKRLEDIEANRPDYWGRM